VPTPRKTYPHRPRPAIDPYAELIDGWLLADRDAPASSGTPPADPRQRLVAEHGAVLAEVAVPRYVARRGSELGLERIEVTVPQ
jgi:hypothetical protein